MTSEKQLSGASRMGVVFVALFLCGTFVAAINSTAGLVIMSLAPVLGAIQVLGYPSGPDVVRDRLG